MISFFPIYLRKTLAHAHAVEGAAFENDAVDELVAELLVETDGNIARIYSHFPETAFANP